MTERTPVSFPKERIHQRSPQSETEEELEKLGTRILTVDITPDSLRGDKAFQEDPLSLTIYEILPRGSSRTTGPFEGFFINLGSHKDEPTSFVTGVELISDLAHMENRPSFNVVSTGLSAAVERLSHYIFDKQIDIGEDPLQVDPNRKCILPGAQTQDPYEEMMQKYLEFVISKYFPQNLAFLDLHSESTEYEVLPHAILGRTAPEDMANDFYQWAVDSFPDFSVVWDIEKKDYYEQQLEKSFADVLLSCGRFSMTIECAAGKGGIQEPNKHLTKATILSAMLHNNLLDEDEARGVIAEERAKASFLVQPTANRLLDSPLRRAWVQVPIAHGAFQHLEGITGKVLVGGSAPSKIGDLICSGPLSTTPIYIPSHIDQCVLLGIPDDGIYDGNHNNRMYLSLAVRDV